MKTKKELEKIQEVIWRLSLLNLSAALLFVAGGIFCYFMSEYMLMGYFVAALTGAIILYYLSLKDLK